MTIPLLEEVTMILVNQQVAHVEGDKDIANEAPIYEPQSPYSRRILSRVIDRLGSEGMVSSAAFSDHADYTAHHAFNQGS